MQTWIVTGISGSGRIELLKELGTYATGIKKNIMAHDVGQLIQDECKEHKIDFTHQHILDLDQKMLEVLRAGALKEVTIRVLQQPHIDIHFIGVHSVFRWKNRLIPGLSYADLTELKPDGFLNIVDDVKRVHDTNSKNPKWDMNTVPNFEETQDWMNEEEFITELLADIFNKPMFLIARQHNVPNLADLFFTTKKKIYLSYPISLVRQDNPELLEKIQGNILSELEKMFVVFNPLTISDMSLTYQEVEKELPQLIGQLTPKAKEIIKTRTVERDFQFIDQADAVVVFYLTEKVSPGVLAEIYYAHRNQKPVFMVYPGARSPFMEDAATYIENDMDALMDRLKDFAKQ